MTDPRATPDAPRHATETPVDPSATPTGGTGFDVTGGASTLAGMVVTHEHLWQPVRVLFPSESQVAIESIWDMYGKDYEDKARVVSVCACGVWTTRIFTRVAKSRD